MEILGGLESSDSTIKAEIFRRPTGTYGFRIYHWDAAERVWTMRSGRSSECVVDSVEAAIAEAVGRHPALDAQQFRPTPPRARAEQLPATAPHSSRASKLLLRAGLAWLIGVPLLLVARIVWIISSGSGADLSWIFTMASLSIWLVPPLVTLVVWVALRVRDDDDFAQ